MFKKNVFNAHNTLVSNFKILSLLHKVYADSEGDSSNTESNEDSNNQTNTSINFEQLILQARKEEKDKLYPRIKKLEGENSELVKDKNNLLLKLGTIQQELDTLKNSQTDLENSELVKNLKEEIKTLKENLEKVEKVQVDKEALRSEIEKEYNLKLYTKDKIAENSDNILSILKDTITGNTQEEVDKAIEEAKKKTLEVKKDLGLLNDDKKNNPTNTNKPKKSITVSPADSDSFNEYSADYIRNLDPHSPEYAAFRKKMGLR